MNDYIINAEELSLCYQNDNVVVVDCRFSLGDAGAGERLYHEAHIPGAHYLHLDRDLSGAKGLHGGRHPLPRERDFVSKLREIGVDSKSDPSRVVVYDDSRFAFASRLWWLLRYYGHQRVSVLDGGFQAWCDLGCETDQRIPPADGGNFEASLRSRMLVDKAYVESMAARADNVLIDSREEPRFQGIEEPIDPVAGHIEGAVNYPWQAVTSAQGFILEAAQLQAHWAAVTGSEERVVYCGSGVTACVNLLSLALIGQEDAKLYAGSWSDWCSYL